MVKALIVIYIPVLVMLFCCIYTAASMHYLVKDVFKHWLETIKLNQEVIKLNNEILEELKKENTNA